MKKLLSFGLMLILIVTTVSTVSAQLGTTDVSSFAIQNLGSGQALVTVTFYDEGGAATQPTVLNSGQPNPFTLDPGKGWEIYVPAIPDTELPNGRYSVVIESTEPVAVTANLSGQSTNRGFNGSYSGFEAGGTPIYLPSIFYNYWGWYSLVSVQNTTPDDVDVTVNYYWGTDLIAKHTKSNLAGFASVHFDWETDLPTLEPGKSFPGPNVSPLSAKVEAVKSSDQTPANVVAVDNQTVPSSGSTQSYNGFLSGARDVYVPSLFNSYYGWFSSMLIQNVGGVATTVTVTFNDGCQDYFDSDLGSVQNSSFTLQPSQAKQLLFRYDLTSCHGQEVTFGAEIDSTDADIAAIVNQASWPAAPTFKHKEPVQAQAYNGFDTPNTDWGLPTIFQKYYGWDTSFSFQNVGTGPTNVEITYSENFNPYADPYAGCTFTHTGLTAGESVEYYQPNHAAGGTPGAPPGCAPLPDGYQGTISLHSTTSEPLVAQVNETNAGETTGTGGDWSMSYNGFGK